MNPWVSKVALIVSFLNVIVTGQEPKPLGHADKGANLKIEHVVGPECVAKDETGRYQVFITDRFSCTGEDVHHLTCGPGSFQFVLKTGCDQIRIVKAEPVTK